MLYKHSPATLLETPYKISQSVCSNTMHKNPHHRYRRSGVWTFTSNIRLDGRKMSSLTKGALIMAWQLVPDGFVCMEIKSFWNKSNSGGCVDEKGQRRIDGLVRADRKATATQIPLFTTTCSFSRLQLFSLCEPVPSVAPDSYSSMRGTEPVVCRLLVLPPLDMLWGVVQDAFLLSMSAAQTSKAKRKLIKCHWWGFPLLFFFNMKGAWLCAFYYIAAARDPNWFKIGKYILDISRDNHNQIMGGGKKHN